MEGNRGGYPCVDKRSTQRAEGGIVKGPSRINAVQRSRDLSRGTPKGAEGGRESEITQRSEFNRQKKTFQRDEKVMRPGVVRAGC